MSLPLGSAFQSSFSSLETSTVTMGSSQLIPITRGLWKVGFARS